jgi:hypothetical protein
VNASTALAPTAPGRLGEAIDPAAMLTYLGELASWRDQRRRELDRIDQLLLQQATQPVPTPPSLDDITLSMALWQAVATRFQELTRVWDSGRVGVIERQQLATLIWGRLDQSGSAAMSVPEACRLSDALAAQLLRASDPQSANLEVRLREIRTTIERIRQSQPGADPRQLADLDRRHRELAEQAARGGDVGGFVPVLEAEAARAERDLIVAAGQRQQTAREVQRAHDWRAELLRRGESAQAQAQLCAATITSPPRLAVPQVQLLGPVPTGSTEVSAYLTRLATVERALTTVEATYAAPLAERAQLAQQLTGLVALAEATDRARDHEVTAVQGLAEALLTATPTDLPRSRAIVAAYQSLLGPPSAIRERTS